MQNPEDDAHCFLAYFWKSNDTISSCMAPLLLRPLLAGECELEDDFDDNRDNSAQLLAAANAANNAQAIIATLLEEYDSIFDVSFSLFCLEVSFWPFHYWVAPFGLRFILKS